MNQKKMPDPTVVHSISQNLFTTLPLVRKQLLQLDIAQGEHSLPLSHIQVLSMLSESGGLTVSEISNRLGIAKPNITPLVDKLAEQNLVHRVRDLQDRRVVNILLLEGGRKRLAEIEESMSARVSEWAQRISTADFAGLSKALQDLSRILLLI